MKDQDKTKAQLIDELVKTRLQLSRLERLEVRSRKTIEKVKFSRQQLRLLIDAGPDFFFLKDIDLRYQLVNSALAQFFGRCEADVLGKNDFDLMPVKNAAVACQKSDRLAIREKRIVVTREQVRKRCYETYKFPVFIDEKIVGVAGIIRDITDRLRAEDALRRNEALRNAILSNVGAYIYLKDNRYCYTYVNDKVCRLFSLTEKAIIGKDDSHFFSASSVEEIMRSDRRVIEHGETIAREERDLTSSDILPRTYWVVKLPLKDSRGNICGLCGISTDITDHKRADEALKQSENRLSGIIEFLPDATFVIDLDGKVSAWNRAIEQMTGISKENMIGRGDHAYMIPFYGERRRHLVDLIDAVNAGDESKYQYVHRKGNTLHAEAFARALYEGKGAYVYATAAPIFDRDGNRVGAIESIRDITDLKKAEEKYRGIFDNAVMGICQINPEKRILSANPAFARILGYESPEEVVSAITDVTRQLFVDVRRYDELRHLVLQNTTIQMQEVELYRKDRSTILVHTSGRAVRDGGGTPIYYEGTIQDITDISRLEAQLRQAQKMEAIGTLAGGIAHDFNNILASMMGYTEMAGKETRQENRQKYLHQVSRACERAKNLVDQILSFSRRREEERRPLNIRLIVKEALGLLRASLPATIEIKQDITVEEVYVLADSTQIHQIVMNLCTNAAQAMPEGGLLTVNLSRVQMDENGFCINSDLPPGMSVCLSVEDTGHGIDPAIQGKIFDPFFTTKKAKEGTGLGLSVVYGIVKSCGGVIDVQSSVGQGAHFTIYLPGVDAENGPEEQDQEETDLQGHERILFVDDEEMLVNMARNYFEPLGYHVAALSGSKEALYLFRDHPEGFDLVITDMTMPEMTGLALSREILRIRPDLPIILCTGYSESVTTADVRKEGIREFCLKPVFPECSGEDGAADSG